MRPHWALLWLYCTRLVKIKLVSNYCETFALHWHVSTGGVGQFRRTKIDLQEWLSVIHCVHFYLFSHRDVTIFIYYALTVNKSLSLWTVATHPIRNDHHWTRQRTRKNSRPAPATTSGDKCRHVCKVLDHTRLRRTSAQYVGAVPQTIYWSTVGLRRYEIQTDVVFDSRLDLCVCNYFRLLPVFAAFANHRGEHLRGVCSIIVTQGGGGAYANYVSRAIVIHRYLT